MWGLISSKDQRSYKIIEILYNSDEPITINTLANETNSSVRTVKYELDDLRKNLENQQGKIISSPEGITLQLPPYMGIDFFQRKLLASSLGFQLLEIIFFNEQLSNKDIEKMLFISSSSLSRLTNTIKNELGSYGLSLEMNPFRVVGKEKLVRSFYSSYFKERYTINDWPFERVNRDLLSEILSIGFNYYNANPDSTDSFQLLILFAVGITRAFNGYPQKPSISRSTATQNRQFQTYSQYIKEIAVKTKTSPEDLQVYFNELLSWKYLLKLKNPDEQNNPETIEEENCLEIKNLIEMLGDLFDLPVRENTYLIVEINSALDFYASFSLQRAGKRYILFKPRDYFLVEEFKNNYPLFYNCVANQFKKICRNREIDTSSVAVENLVHQLLSKWDGLTSSLFYKFHPCKILLYSHYHLYHAKNIAEELSSLLGRAITVEIHKEKMITKETLAQYNFDILATTTTILMDIDQPVYFIHRKKLTLNTNTLDELIHSCIQKQKDTYRRNVIKKAEELKIDLSKQ